MKIGHVDVGPDRFPVAVDGEGPPVLFVHGAPGDWRTFAPHAALLADRYRCITFTQRWFGTSGWREDGPPFGTSAHAADLIALVQALDVGRVALVAWSYGAHPAMAAAVERPDLFSGLFVYEPGFATFITEPSHHAAYKADAERAWGLVFAASQTGDGEQLLRARWDASGGDGSFDSLPDAAKDELRAGIPALFKLLRQTPPAPVTAEALAGMQIPAAGAWGAGSRPCYTIPSEAAADAIGGERQEVPDAGHLWPAFDPDGFARLVGSWLDRLGEGGAL